MRQCSIENASNDMHIMEKGEKHPLRKIKSDQKGEGTEAFVMRGRAHVL